MYSRKNKNQQNVLNKQNKKTIFRNSSLEQFIDSMTYSCFEIKNNNTLFTHPK